MGAGVDSRRPYHSPRRLEQARATRGAILEGARQLFVQDGFVATTVEAIAGRAQVSPETVYATFKKKRSILSALIDVSIAGDDMATPILERGWVQDLRDARDPQVRLRILARNARLILERMTPIYGVLLGAATADAEIASMLDAYKAQRYAGQRALLRLVANDGTLRSGLSDRAAADIIFAIGSPETYRTLIVDRGWSADRFERWYAETLARLLLVE